MIVTVISRVIPKVGLPYNEWVERCNSWQKAWKLAKSVGAEKEECEKDGDVLWIFSRSK
jgi:hypothetical protein